MIDDSLRKQLTNTHVITSKYIFDGTSLLEDKAIVIIDGVIIDIIDRQNVAASSNIEDYGDCVLTSGLIDLQLNGCGGVSVNDSISFATLEQMHQTNLRFGTTHFLPTFVTADFRQVLEALELVKAWFQKYDDTKGVLGLHLEGPFISKEKKGTHSETLVIMPTEELLQQIIPYA